MRWEKRRLERVFLVTYNKKNNRNMGDDKEGVTQPKVNRSGRCNQKQTLGDLSSLS